MARIKINDIESASLASESYLNDLQEVEMTSVKGGFLGLFVWFVAVAVVSTQLHDSSPSQSSSQPGPEQKSNDTSWSSWSWLDEMSASGGAGGY